MIIEFGNEAAHRAIDEAPRVTQIHIPEADEHGLGGYSHAPGLSVEEFRKHITEAMMFNDGITHLPEHELLQSVAAAWPRHSRLRPTWVNVIPSEGHPVLDAKGHPTDKVRGRTPDGHQDDLHAFLEEHFGCKVGKPANVEDTHWTQHGGLSLPPGVHPPEPSLPPLEALFTNTGRTQQAVNYGGGQTGLIGAGTAATATTLTTNLTLVTNAWAGYRVYVYSTSSNNIVWGNVLSNTNAASASVLTVDRWYNAATPGGSAGTTPTTPWAFILADGGVVSGWFCGMTTTNITPAAGDTTMTGEYTTAGGGYIRKISPYSLTSGTSPMTYTLTPVFTGNGSDSYPQTFYAVSFGPSMVNTAALQKFETSLNASATVAASGDQVTVTETCTGS